MLETVGFCIVDAKAWVAESSHDFAGIGPDCILKLMDVPLMVMAAEYSVEGGTFGDSF